MTDWPAAICVHDKHGDLLKDHTGFLLVSPFKKSSWAQIIVGFLFLDPS